LPSARGTSRTSRFSNTTIPNDVRLAPSRTLHPNYSLYDADVKKIDRSVLDSQEFRNLVVGRWRISLLLTALLFILYYGYIILIATNRQLVSRPVRGSTTAGILIAAAVIVGAWALTAAYVVWANRHYDPAVERLRARAEAK
jgi:uncharacterized membrane protein (DUF485 family)